MAATSANTLSSTSNSPRGKSQWALIWSEFCKRRLALAAAALILALITTSIFAPILANARPIYYFGFNRFEYQEAARTLRGALAQMIESRSTDNPNTNVEAFLKTVPLQIDLMANALPAEKGGQIRELGQQVLAAIKSSDKQQGTDELKRLQREVRSNFDAKDVSLVSHANWPVLASLNGLDIGFLIANLLFLTLPIWGWLIRSIVPSDGDRRRQWCFVAVQIGLPLLAGGLWWWFVPTRVDRTDYKNGVLAADPE
ncbi:MAG: hypothetical protein WCH39_07560, partial [Schlesneria sp.]